MAPKPVANADLRGCGQAGSEAGGKASGGARAGAAKAVRGRAQAQGSLWEGCWRC